MEWLELSCTRSKLNPAILKSKENEVQTHLSISFPFDNCDNVNPARTSLLRGGESNLRNERFVNYTGQELNYLHNYWLDY